MLDVGLIGGLVWYDNNANGVKDSNEPPVAGVSLTLNGTSSFDNSSMSFSAGTDSNGRYTFGNLPPGNYTVSITVAPSGFVLTTPGPGTSTDSDFSPSTKSTGIITLAAGQSLPSVDAGLVQLGE